MRSSLYKSSRQRFIEINSNYEIDIIVYNIAREVLSSSTAIKKGVNFQLDYLLYGYTALATYNSIENFNKSKIYICL